MEKTTEKNKNAAKQGILLETGTNEIEVLEFVIGNQSFGINALKVRELIQYKGMNVTALGGLHPAILGTVIFRGLCVSLLDLGSFLTISSRLTDNHASKTVIFTEFNKHTIGFLVESIVGIKRISWSNIQPPNSLLNVAPITGIAVVGDHEVAMLDFESITQNVGIGSSISEIAAKTSFKTEDDKREQRAKMNLMACDDAPIIRKSIKWTLENANYKQLQIFENGQQVYDEFKKLKTLSQNNNVPVTKYLNAIVTDIEMPAMDGLTLCKKVKEESPDVVVIIVSSMVNEQMAARCEKVNADGYLSKSDLNKLIEMIDNHIL